MTTEPIALGCVLPDVMLDMVTSRTFDNRIQLLEYVPRVLSGPPGANSGS